MSGSPMGRLFEVCLTAGVILGDARGKQVWQGLDRSSITAGQPLSPSNPCQVCFPLHLFLFPCRFLQVFSCHSG